MTIATYRAALMDASGGGNRSYAFEAPADLFRLPASDIVERFIDSLHGAHGVAPLLFYELDSAVLKRDEQIVMATGSLDLGRGGIPFALMISPAA